MSSFLMNPGASSYQHQQHLGGAPVVVDPKFPPTEEYSQNNYIPSSGGDFFGGHHLNHPQHHLQYGYHNHHQGTTYQPNIPNGYGYSNYYHHQLPTSHPGIHSHQLRPALSMHTDQQISCPIQNQSHQTASQPPVTSSSILQSSTILQSLADIAPSIAPTQPSGEISSGVCSPASVGHGQGQDSRGSPPGHPLGDLGLRLEDNNSDDHDELDDDHMLESPLMDDDDDDDSESGDRVIYPWMKKIHVAGVGKSRKLYFFTVKMFFMVETYMKLELVSQEMRKNT